MDGTPRRKVLVYGDTAMFGEALDNAAACPHGAFDHAWCKQSRSVCAQWGRPGSCVCLQCCFSLTETGSLCRRFLLLTKQNTQQNHDY
jgi:hypothetical protein